MTAAVAATAAISEVIIIPTTHFMVFLEFFSISSLVAIC